MRIWLTSQENLPAGFVSLCRQFVFGPEFYFMVTVRPQACGGLGESVDRLLLELRHDRVDEILNSLLLIGGKGGNPVAIDRKGIGRRCGRGKEIISTDAQRFGDDIECVYINVNRAVENASQGGRLNMRSSGQFGFSNVVPPGTHKAFNVGSDCVAYCGVFHRFYGSQVRAAADAFMLFERNGHAKFARAVRIFIAV